MPPPGLNLRRLGYNSAHTSPANSARENYLNDLLSRKGKGQKIGVNANQILKYNFEKLILNAVRANEQTEQYKHLISKIKLLISLRYLIVKTHLTNEQNQQKIKILNMLYELNHANVNSFISKLKNKQIQTTNVKNYVEYMKHIDNSLRYIHT